jgi:hypothetical protein
MEAVALEPSIVKHGSRVVLLFFGTELAGTRIAGGKSK